MAPQLTPEMQQALTDHPDEPVYVVDNATQQAYVLLPPNTYQKIQALLYDVSEPRPGARQLLQRWLGRKNRQQENWRIVC